MSRIRVTGRRPLRGTLRLPSDLQLGQQAILWAALSSGSCLIAGLSPRADHGLLAAALREMGVPIADTDAGLRIKGVGLRGLRAPRGALQAGDSTTTLQILATLLCGQPFGTRIEAHGRAARSSLRTLIEPLRARGAAIAGRADGAGDSHAPVAVAPLLAGERLADVEIEIPDGDAGTKLALFVTGLYTSGVTAVSEGRLSPDHVERALLALGAPIETMGGMAVLDTSAWQPHWGGFSWHIPADFTLAAHLIAAAAVIPGSDLVLTEVAVNRTRAAFLDALRHAGADVEVTPRGDAAGDEPIAQVRVRHGAPRGVRLSGELARGLAAELAAVAVLALGATARSSVRDVSPVCLTKPDPLRALSHCLRLFGCECTDYADGFDVDPAGRPRGVALTADQMDGAELAALCVALVAEGDSLLDGHGPIEVVFPGAVAALRAVGAGVEMEGDT